MDRAVIFDMDGVLVDSYEAHFDSWRDLAAEHGRTFSPRDFARTFGRTSRDIIASVWGGAPLSAAAIERLDQRKETLFRVRLARQFPAMDGAPELLHALAAAGFRIAVGSSGPPENVDLVLDRLGARDLFDAVVNGHDVTHGKPDPEVFLLAAARLGVAPVRCVVVEDAPAGIEAATRAGMSSVALLSTGRIRTDFDDVAPSLVLGSLRDLSPGIFEALVERRPIPDSRRRAPRS
jgi:beta-phosphoglucomutase